MAKRWSNREDRILARAMGGGNRTVKEITIMTAASLPDRSFAAVDARVRSIGNYRRVRNILTVEQGTALARLDVESISKVEFLNSAKDISSVDTPVKRELVRWGPMAVHKQKANLTGRQSL